MRYPKRYFIYYGDLTEGIFDSQVLFHISLMRRYEYKFTLICFIPFKSIFKTMGKLKKKIQNIKDQNIKCICFFTFNPMRWHGRVLNFLYLMILAGFFKFNNLMGYYVIIHARETFPARLGLGVKKFGIRGRLIFDMRSEKVSEYRYQQRNIDNAGRLEKRLLNIDKQQKMAIERSDVCLFISHALKDYVSKKYSIKPNQFHIIPSAGRSDYFFFDDKERLEMKNCLGLENRFVIGYSGSMNLWQKVDKVLDIFSYTLKIHKNTSLLILTRDTEQAKQLCKNLEEEESKKIIIKNIDYDKLGKYLQCIDMGVILRDKLILNKVSSPTKFAEYTLCGVPVFISTGIGDLEVIVKNHNLGICIENIEVKNEFEIKINQFMNSQFNRNAIAEFAKKSFSRKAYLHIYKEIYSYSKENQKK